MWKVAKLSEIDTWRVINNRTMILVEDPPCHVPKFNAPSVMGIEMVLPTSDAFVCDTLKSENHLQSYLVTVSADGRLKRDSTHESLKGNRNAVRAGVPDAPWKRIRALTQAPRRYASS